MADRLDAVNASFEDCEEQDDDVEIMQTEETAPTKALQVMPTTMHIRHFSDVLLTTTQEDTSFRSISELTVHPDSRKNIVGDTFLQLQLVMCLQKNPS